MVRLLGSRWNSKLSSPPQLLLLKYYYQSFNDSLTIRVTVNSPLSTSSWYYWHQDSRSDSSGEMLFSPEHCTTRKSETRILRFFASLHITCFFDMVYEPLINNFGNFPALDIVPWYFFHFICAHWPTDWLGLALGLVLYAFSSDWTVQIAEYFIIVHRSRLDQLYVPSVDLHFPYRWHQRSMPSPLYLNGVSPFHGTSLYALTMLVTISFFVARIWHRES